MKRLLSIVLLLSILLPSMAALTLPAPVHAATATSIIAQKGGCVASGIAAGWLNGVITKSLEALQKKIKDIASKYVQNLLGSLVEGLLSSSVPTSSRDQSMLSFFQNKYYRDDVIARCLARLQLDNITNNISEIVKTRGRDGGPTYVTNWRQFITSAQYRGENVFRAMLSTANLCSYFGSDIKKSYGLKATDKIALPGVNTRIGNTAPFSLQVNCTLPSNFSLESYRQNFAAMGGWDTAAKLAQPQNNPAGVALLAQDQIDLQRKLEETSDIVQTQTNRGQTGISGTSKKDSCRITGLGGQCIVYKDIKTTGEYLAENVAASVGAQFGWIVSAQGLNSLIEDVTQSMINKLFDQSDTRGSAIATDPVLTIPGVSTTPVPIPQALCVRDDEKVKLDPVIKGPPSVTDLMAALDTADFENVIGKDRKNEIKIQVQAGLLDDKYIRLYNIEKSLLDPARQELKSLIQSWEDVIRSTVQTINTNNDSLQWNTSVERTDTDRQLLGLKDSMKSIVDQYSTIPACTAASTPNLGGNGENPISSNPTEGIGTTSPNI